MEERSSTVDRKLVTALVLIAAGFFRYKPSKATNLNEGCIACHSVKGRAPKILQNGDKMYLYVNKEKFLKSPHAEVGCLACHADVNPKIHPRPIPIKSLRAYARQVNKRCLICHPIKSLSKHPGHAVVVRSGMLCTTCHTYHEGRRISAWKKKVWTQQYCLTCHKYAFKKRLPDGEVLNVKVSLSELKHSVHKNFYCTVCHRDFSKEKHPVYRFKSKKEYMVYFSQKVCKSCHTDAQLKQNPAHYALSKTASCIECHGYHGVQSVSQVKNLSENAYCLTCHSRDIRKTLADGETISLKVDSLALMHSVHKNFKCSQCHTGYSKTSHPVKEYTLWQILEKLEMRYVVNATPVSLENTIRVFTMQRGSLGILQPQIVFPVTDTIM